MKEKETTKHEEMPKAEKPFKGYTMEELKHQRALLALRKDFCKLEMMESVNDLRPQSRNSGKKGSSKFALAGRIASLVFSNMNTLDYILMGISLFGSAKKGVRLLRGKK